MPGEPEESGKDIAQLLADSGAGRPGAEDQLFQLVYDDLFGIAERLRRSEPEPSFSAHEIVSEAYLRLGRHRQASCGNRSHFLSIATYTMRWLLIDRARRRRAQKRGGHATRENLTAAMASETFSSALDPLEALALQEALEDLAAKSPLWARVVELRFFGGLGFEEIARAIGVHVITAKRYWRRARDWLRVRMAPEMGMG